MTTGNKSIIEAACSEWNRGNLDGYLSMYDRDIVLHGYDGVEPGKENVARFYEEFWSAFPGSELIFHDLIAEGDRLTCRFTVRGTHGGSFQGLPATGKPFSMDGITILRFTDGRCVERWSQADFLSLLTQLGMMQAAG